MVIVMVFVTDDFPSVAVTVKEYVPATAFDQLNVPVAVPTEADELNTAPDGRFAAVSVILSLSASVAFISNVNGLEAMPVYSEFA